MTGRMVAAVCRVAVVARMGACMKGGGFPRAYRPYQRYAAWPPKPPVSFVAFLVFTRNPGYLLSI
jgi:hypothetical protein